jgi:hypothetical protein
LGREAASVIIRLAAQAPCRRQPLSSNVKPLKGDTVPSMDAALKFLSERSCYWWINESGIVLEIVGAALLVAAAFKSRNEIKNINDTWDANLTEKLRDVIASQAMTELKGFVLLALGLLFQMVGGFGG